MLALKLNSYGVYGVPVDNLSFKMLSANPIKTTSAKTVDKKEILYKPKKTKTAPTSFQTMNREEKIKKLQGL